MLNLLPPQYKEELHQEENFRVALVLEILVLAFFLCFSLLLVSIRIYLAGEINAQKVIVEAQKKDLQRDEAVQRTIKTTNVLVAQLSSFYKNQARVSKILARVSDALPGRVFLTLFTYTPYPAGAEGAPLGKVSLSGFAPTSDDLLALKRNLEKDEVFFHMNFPPTNWVQFDEFSLAVEIHPTAFFLAE